MYIQIGAENKATSRENEMAIEFTQKYTKKRPDFSMVEILILKSARNLVPEFTKVHYFSTKSETYFFSSGIMNSSLRPSMVQSLN